MKQSEILMRLGLEAQRVFNQGVIEMRDATGVEDFDTAFYSTYYRIYGINDAGGNLLTDKHTEILERFTDQLITKVDAIAPKLKEKAREKERVGDGE